ncbi:hypothetical protein CAter282_2862 [Collimonas arenae]|uniref:Uncharacterized protein n=1 Tax=Collimonas arenae TaxID=279058 RepID=A0A127PSA2_9BURK|nr:hypothetical protein [Collimonas arenae]AMP00698.1 hypothetical protein CAter10_3153 [Collimonas arenae]AMP10586.1 hypothetical protein CAter282_2862 [Collimonas arenae]
MITFVENQRKTTLLPDLKTLRHRENMKDDEYSTYPHNVCLAQHLAIPAGIEMRPSQTSGGTGKA